MRRKDREITDMNTITSILDMCRTASIAMVDGDVPYVIPLSYGYEIKEHTLFLYFHCAKEGRKLDILKSNNKVCFNIFHEGEPMHADIPCHAGYYYSSITGNGIVEFIEDSADKKHALNRMFLQQTGQNVEFTGSQADSVCVFQIISNNYTGKQKAKRCRT